MRGDRSCVADPKGADGIVARAIRGWEQTARSEGQSDEEATAQATGEAQTKAKEEGFQLDPSAVMRRNGRPPGQVLKSTDAWRKYMMAQHGSPLVALGRHYSADPRMLANYLRCTFKEAADIILTASRIALPYLHSAMPADLRVEGRGAFVFAQFQGPAPDGAGSGGNVEGDGEGDPAAMLAKWYGEQAMATEAPPPTDIEGEAVVVEHDTAPPRRGNDDSES